MTAGEPPAEPAAAQGPPDDPELLMQQIEQTREQLGETVDQLAAKVDVKSRARDKVAQLTGRAKSSTAQAREQAATRAANARGQLAGTTGAARDKALSAGQAAKGQLQSRAATAAASVRQATPEPVRQAVVKGTGAARQRPVPLAVAAAVLIVGLIALRQWRKR